jgi:hypothetical protein
LFPSASVRMETTGGLDARRGFPARLECRNRADRGVLDGVIRDATFAAAGGCWSWPSHRATTMKSDSTIWPLRPGTAACSRETSFRFAGGFARWRTGGFVHRGWSGAAV